VVVPSKNSTRTPIQQVGIPRTDTFSASRAAEQPSSDSNAVEIGEPRATAIGNPTRKPETTRAGGSLAAVGEIQDQAGEKSGSPDQQERSTAKLVVPVTNAVAAASSPQEIMIRAIHSRAPTFSMMMLLGLEDK